jgi:hypothetical protein
MTVMNEQQTVNSVSTPSKTPASLTPTASHASTVPEKRSSTSGPSEQNPSSPKIPRTDSGTAQGNLPARSGVPEMIQEEVEPRESGEEFA